MVCSRLDIVVIKGDPDIGISSEGGTTERQGHLGQAELQGARHGSLSPSGV